MFKQRKPKRFNLESRLHKENSTDTSFSDKWQETRTANTKRKSGLSLGMLFVILIILLLSMYWLEQKL